MFRRIRSFYIHFISLAASICLCPLISFGQDTVYEKNSFAIEFIANTGKIVKNTRVFPEIDPCVLNELNLCWQTNGNKRWHHQYGFPEFGVSLVYAYQGNDEILGRTYAILPNIAFHAFRTEKRSVEIRLASGFSYFPVIHDYYTNPDNMLIGSHINDISSASITYTRKLSEKIQFKIGAASFHFSNGHYQLPNAGINSVVGTVGLKYFPANPCTTQCRKKAAKEKSPVLLNIRAGAGIHDFGVGTEVGRPKFRVYAASVYASKQVGRLSNVHIGFMNKYYTNYYDFMCDSSLYAPDKRKIRSNTFSLMLGHEFICGRVSLLTQGGINLFNPFAKYYYSLYETKSFKNSIERYICTRLGFQYYVFMPSPSRRFNIFTGIYLNANFGQADFPEISAGISF